MAVRYDLSFPNAAHHEAQVRATFSGTGSGPLEIVMSRSSPGRYALHEFAKNISDLRASDGDDHPLAMERLNTNVWVVKTSAATVICSYTVFGDRADGTYLAIDGTHAHLNLPAVLVWARGWEHAPATLSFHVPERSNWKAATQLIPAEDGTFSASELEWMMDSPVELSDGSLREWKWDSASFRLALHHNGPDAEADVLAGVCKAIVAEEENVFGAFPKFDGGPYTFLVDYLPADSNDGMEHRNSTVITSTAGGAGVVAAVTDAVAHEFFHAWNVKRIRPRSLEPFDFERADMSGELWFAEGFTNYYGKLVLRRADLMSFDAFVEDMGHAVNSVLNSPGRLVNSVVDMSDEAPFVDAAVSIDPTNRANNYISYYTFGQALAFGIDLAIRSRYPGKSLDDWMRTIWHEHADISRPYQLEDLERTLAATTGDAKFADDIFKLNIKGLQPLDYAGLAASAGISLVLAHPGRVWLGASRLTEASGGLMVTSPTLRGSPLYLAGVDTGDQLQRCGGKELKTLSDLDHCLGLHKAGEEVNFDLKGRAGLRSLSVTLVQDPSVMLIPDERLGKPVSHAVQQFRDRWWSSAVRSVGQSTGN